MDIYNICGIANVLPTNVFCKRVVAYQWSLVRTYNYFKNELKDFKLTSAVEAL